MGFTMSGSICGCIAMFLLCVLDSPAFTVCLGAPWRCEHDPDVPLKEPGVRARGEVHDVQGTVLTEPPDLATLHASRSCNQVMPPCMPPDHATHQHASWALRRCAETISRAPHKRENVRTS